MITTDYKILRSNRKTLGLQVTETGLLVRAPYQITNQQINAFILQHKSWIEKQLNQLEKQQEQLSQVPAFTMEELQELAEKAGEYIPARVAFYAPMIGVTYNRITIRSQKTRWGSCSAKGNLNFNCLLMLMPPEVIDSVVVHELCHLKEMNHSRKFYAHVLRVYPDYPKWNQWLKKHGKLFIMRMIK